MSKITVHELVSTVAGIGYFPYAPGTLGSVAGFAVCFLLKGSWFLYSAGFLVFFFAGVFAAGKTEKLKKKKDPSCIVIDEFACMFPVFFMLPMTFLTAIVGFALYRAFDILKPFPINRIEKIEGAWGIMLDDLAAAVFAHILLRALVCFL
jgi:phosphatidylglycerophosphatase A